MTPRQRLITRYAAVIATEARKVLARKRAGERVKYNVRAHCEVLASTDREYDPSWSYKRFESAVINEVRTSLKGQ